MESENDFSCSGTRNVFRQRSLRDERTVRHLRGFLSRKFFSPSGVFFAIAIVSVGCLHAGWRDSLSSDVAGPVPPIRPFEAEFRMGWSDIDAARAKVTIGYQGENVRVAGSGATTGLARLLWQLDATLEATSATPNFQTVYSIQQESYAKRTIAIQIVSRPDGIWRLRENNPPGENPARWTNLKISPLRDLFSGTLFIRSKILSPGETVSTIVYPGDAPFLVEMKSLGVEKIAIAGSPREAIKLDLKIHRINMKKGESLEAHEKFQNGTVWLSNDADRIPLRIEVNIFVGYVFAELESITFKAR
jgi:Protein of unknown function (DUF3108)